MGSRTLSYIMQTRNAKFWTKPASSLSRARAHTHYPLCLHLCPSFFGTPLSPPVLTLVFFLFFFHFSPLPACSWLSAAPGRQPGRQVTLPATYRAHDPRARFCKFVSREFDEDGGGRGGGEADAEAGRPSCIRVTRGSLCTQVYTTSCLRRRPRRSLCLFTRILSFPPSSTHSPSVAYRRISDYESLPVVALLSPCCLPIVLPVPSCNIRLERTSE